MLYENEIEKYVLVVMGKSFIKSISHLENQATLFVNFYSSFEEYKKENPNTLFSIEDYQNYFTESKIEKLLVEDTARLLMALKDIEIVSVVLEFSGTSYNVNISREDFNSHIGIRLEELSPEDGSWQTEFVSVYTGGIKNERRKKLLEHFSK